MHKRIILPLAAIIILAAVFPAAASEIKIAASELSHFVGTYNAKQNTFSDYTIAEWDEDNPMGYQNAVDQFPDTKGVFFGLAPWYAGLVQAILAVPDEQLTFVSFVDVKLSAAARAIVTKWKNIGDSLEFVCVTGDFPDLGGAPNLDGYYRFPDSSHFMLTRSAGGGMEEIWHNYSFIVEEPDCRWKEIYRLESQHLMYEPEFVERWCRLVDSAAPVYFLRVFSRHFKAKGEKKSDGTYTHEQVKIDTTMINLWDLTKQARE